MFNKNIIIIFIVFFSLLVQAQEYRYTNTIFSSSNSTENVVYQTAPSINSPYTIESNTLNEDLKPNTTYSFNFGQSIADYNGW